MLDVEVMKSKPRMPVSKKPKIQKLPTQPSGGAKSSPTQAGSFIQSQQSQADIQKPLSPIIRRSAINNLVGNPSTQNQSNTSMGPANPSIDTQNVASNSSSKNQSNLRSPLYEQ